MYDITGERRSRKSKFFINIPNTVIFIIDLIKDVRMKNLLTALVAIVIGVNVMVGVGVYVVLSEQSKAIDVEKKVEEKGRMSIKKRIDHRLKELAALKENGSDLKAINAVRRIIFNLRASLN